MKRLKLLLLLLCAKCTFSQTDLDTLRTATSVTILNSAGTDALIKEADFARAGVMTAADKRKVDRIELLKDYDELRAVTNLDTSVNYRLVQTGMVTDFYYDPDDNSSADDTATVVVTTGGARLKRIFDGIYRPEDFGAKGDGVTNDWWAWQKMMNYIETSDAGGMVWCDARANYMIDTSYVIDLPKLSNGKSVVMYGNGCRMTGKRIFRRRPPNQTAALNEWQGVSIIIRNFIFHRAPLTLTGNSVAVDIGATYGTELSNNQFFNTWDTCAIIRFGLNTRSVNNTYIGKTGFYATYGGIWGGNTSNSQSNATVSEQDRCLGASNGFAGMYFEAASDCEVKNVIIEGTAMPYGIYFDSRGSTVVQNFTVSGGHLEYPAAASRAYFYLRGSGLITISGIYVQIADTLITADQTSSLEVKLVDWPWCPSGTKFASTSSGTLWRFESSMNNVSDIHSRFINGGDYVTPSKILVNMYKLSSNFYRTNSNWLIGNADGSRAFGMIEPSGYFLLTDLGLRFSSDNTHDIGVQTTARPRYIYAATAVIADSTAGSFRFGGNTGPGLSMLPNDNQAMKFIRGSGLTSAPTGAIGMPFGTTAQRTTTNLNGLLRLNTDTASFEFKVSNSWNTIATRNWVRDNFAPAEQPVYAVKDLGSTSGTSTQVHSISPPSGGRSGFVQITATGYDADNEEIRTMTRSVTYKRTSAGTLSLYTTHTIGTDDGDAALSAATLTYSTSGGDIEATVTGVTGRTIRWSLLVTWLDNPL